MHRRLIKAFWNCKNLFQHPGIIIAEYFCLNKKITQAKKKYLPVKEL